MKRAKTGSFALELPRQSRRIVEQTLLTREAGQLPDKPSWAKLGPCRQVFGHRAKAARMRMVQRMPDRSRSATNPDCFNPDGTSKKSRRQTA